MFSGLANFFFGSKKNEIDHDGNIVVLSEQQQGSTLNTEEDDGWIVVDQKAKDAEEEILDHNSEEDFGELLSNFLFETVCDYEQEYENNANKSPPSSSPSPSTPSSLAQLDPDGSWYLTPPPCFTAGNAPSSTHVSPMENLLIEHPSMSVYIHNGPVQEATKSTSPAVQQQEKNVSNPGARASRKNGKNPTRRISTIAERAELIITQSFGKHILEQKAEKFHQSKALRRNQLNRSNKVREYSSMNSTQHRKDRLRNVFSGVNNNRKC